ncbi:MAG TPA: tetratricopeptide repeat protein [Blastocatellia bacterium]|nr:tetratricopeptide repeat protein [Blastocatellia bacterium]
MFSIIAKRVAATGALLALLSIAASAQTTQIEGTVKVKAEDGALKPVAGALVDIYRTDVKGHWDVKADKNGHFIRLGLPIQGTFLFVASGPGMAPTYLNNIRISQLPNGVLDFVGNPGDGSTMTLEQVQSFLKSGPSASAAPGARAPSAADKAKAEAAAKEYEAKLKESKELQAGFDAARTHYNTGVELMKATPPNYATALSEFEQAAAVDPGKHAAMAELAYKANANLAETHYQIGVDLFNKKDRAGAKTHFEAAVAAVNKSIVTASGITDNPNINNDLLIYYNILSKNAQLLVEFYGANIVDDTVKSIEKAEAIDPTNKNKWEIAKGKLFQAAGRTDEAVTAYKGVIAADPNNLDALYQLGLTLLGSSDKEKIQESVNALSDFVAKAPATDKRVPDAKSTIEAIKTQFKIEAEKPARRSGRKP